MANDNGWGQGANNNDIGWGQGAYNNTIGWGSIYANSYSGDTEILGNEGGITTLFETRIIADGGIYEADSCLVQTLNF
jgi:hypothetical protein